MPLHGKLAALAAGLLLSSAVPAPAQNWMADPRYGTVSLSSGFLPDPHTINVVAGGSGGASHLGGDCAGSIDPSQPDLDLNFSAGSLDLSIFVESAADTTLVVYDPLGRWHCNDDYSSQSGLNPAIVFSQPLSGNYNIWVGSFAEGTYPPATLKISELAPSWSAGGAGIEWGDNTSQWADDGECDDPRFAGPGMAAALVDADRYHDANDCRTLYQQGRIYLRP